MSEEKVVSYIFIFGGVAVIGALVAWLIAYMFTLHVGAWSLLEPNLSESLNEMSRIILPIISSLFAFVAGYGIAKAKRQ